MSAIPPRVNRRESRLRKQLISYLLFNPAAAVTTGVPMTGWKPASPVLSSRGQGASVFLWLSKNVPADMLHLANSILFRPVPSSGPRLGTSRGAVGMGAIRLSWVAVEVTLARRWMYRPVGPGRPLRP